MCRLYFFDFLLGDSEIMSPSKILPLPKKTQKTRQKHNKSRAVRSSILTSSPFKTSSLKLEKEKRQKIKPKRNPKSKNPGAKRKLNLEKEVGKTNKG